MHRLVLVAALALAGPTLAAPANVTTPVLTKPLAGVPGKEVLVAEVALPPGGASVPHRHNANTFVYVLEGRVEMQVQGGPLMNLGPGEVFYESPTDVHSISRNASAIQPAKVVVFFVKDAGAPATTPTQ